MALTAESQQRRWESVVQASRSTGRLQLRGASLDAGSAATVVQLLLSEKKQPWHVDLEGNELGDRGALCVAELLRQSTDLVWLGLGACGIGPLGGVALVRFPVESCAPSYRHDRAPGVDGGCDSPTALAPAEANRILLWLG